MPDKLVGIRGLYMHDNMSCCHAELVKDFWAAASFFLAGTIRKVMMLIFFSIFWNENLPFFSQSKKSLFQQLVILVDLSVKGIPYVIYLFPYVKAVKINAKIFFISSV